MGLSLVPFSIATQVNKNEVPVGFRRSIGSWIF